MTNVVEPRLTQEHTFEPDGLVGRIQMYTMHEALAREHMRQRHSEALVAQRQRVASEMAAANRWRYLERRANAAYRRHARRAEQAAHSVAVAD
jgi:hypothetical protein